LVNEHQAGPVSGQETATVYEEKDNEINQIDAPEFINNSNAKDKKMAGRNYSQFFPSGDSRKVI
jgi:hypothetical protein